MNIKSHFKTAGALAAVLLVAAPFAAQAQQGQQNYSAPQQQTYSQQGYSQQGYAGQPQQYQGSYSPGPDATGAPPPPPPPGTQTGPNTYAANGAPPPGVDPNAPPPPGDRRYDGYCYERKDQAQASGTIIGAVAGGLIGNSVSNRWNRGSGTVAGALLGGLIGNQVGKSSVECYGGRYYAYSNGYYAPPPPPDGYTVVYYNARPPVDYYSDVVIVGGPGYYYGGPRYYRPYYHRHW